MNKQEIAEAQLRREINNATPPNRNQFACVECDREFTAGRNTIMYGCPDCHKATKVIRLDKKV